MQSFFVLFQCCWCKCVTVVFHILLIHHIICFQIPIVITYTIPNFYHNQKSAIEFHIANTIGGQFVYSVPLLNILHSLTIYVYQKAPDNQPSLNMFQPFRIASIEYPNKVDHDPSALDFLYPFDPHGHQIKYFLLLIHSEKAFYAFN